MCQERHAGRRPLILAYHGVSDEGKSPLFVRPSQFEWQMRYLAGKGMRGVSLEELVAESVCRPEPGVQFGLTFDDGYLDVCTRAWPVLQELGFTATVFLVTDYVGKDSQLTHDGRVRESVEASRLLSWSQVREMHASNIEFGSHTCTHRLLTRLDDHELSRELSESKQRIERELGEQARFVCFPAGDVDERVVAAATDAGYEAAALTPSSADPLMRDRFLMLRIGVYRHTGPLVFRIKTSAPFGALRLNPWSFRLLHLVKTGP